MRFWRPMAAGPYGLRSMKPDRNRPAPATMFGVPLATGEQRIRVTRVVENNEHFQRVMFESLGVGD